VPTPVCVRRYVHRHPPPSFVTLQPAWVTSVPGGAVWGKGAVVTDASGTMIADVSRDFAPRPYLHGSFRRRVPETVTHLAGRAGVLTIGGGDNFFHFLFDACPRIHLLHKAGYSLTELDAIVVNQCEKPFHNELLDLLDVPRSTRVECRPGFSLRADELIVPSIQPTDYHPSWLFSYVRNTLLPRAVGNPAAASSPVRIHISRAKAAGRRVRNNSALQRLLGRYGFTRVVLEQLSVQEQIAMVARADVIVGEHGAGLSHLVFARPGARVVELASPYWPYTMFRHIAAWSGVAYGVVYSQCRNVGAGRGYLDYMADFLVDLAELREVFQAMGIQESLE